MNRFLSFVTGILVITLFISSCKKNSDKPKATGSNSSPTSFTPGSGLVYSAVTINGTGFDTVKSNNTIKFNGVQAVVLSTSATQISVIVPPNATTGAITVATDGKTATLPGTFKVLHMVETDSVSQLVNCLVFDKAGDMFGVKDKSLLKFANGSVKGALSTIYTAPNDSTFNSANCGVVVSPGGSSPYCYLNYFTYTLTSAVIANNNLYVSQQYEKNIFGSNGYSANYFTSILKIDPTTGQVTVFEKNIPVPITSMATDPSGNIYYVSRVQPNIYKIDPSGAITVFAAVNNHYFGCIGADPSGNIYAIYDDPSPDGNDDLATTVRFTPQGVATVLNGPTLYPVDFFSTMFFDASGNLITTNNENLLLINPAGYVSRLPASPIEKIYTDNSGNWYEVSGYDLVKYALK